MTNHISANELKTHFILERGMENISGWAQVHILETVYTLPFFQTLLFPQKIQVEKSIKDFKKRKKRTTLRKIDQNICFAQKWETRSLFKLKMKGE